MPQKMIRSRAYLVINGAPPPISRPLQVGRPTIGNRETFLQRVNQILRSKSPPTTAPWCRNSSGASQPIWALNTALRCATAPSRWRSPPAHWVYPPKPPCPVDICCNGARAVSAGHHPRIRRDRRKNAQPGSECDVQNDRATHRPHDQYTPVGSDVHNTIGDACRIGAVKYLWPAKIVDDSTNAS